MKDLLLDAIGLAVKIVLGIVIAGIAIISVLKYADGAERAPAEVIQPWGMCDNYDDALAILRQIKTEKGDWRSCVPNPNGYLFLLAEAKACVTTFSGNRSCIGVPYDLETNEPIEGGWLLYNTLLIEPAGEEA